MISSYRFPRIAALHHAALLITVACGLVCGSPCFADSSDVDSPSETRADAVPQSILNLDLCTLAYQLYHQSLCLPLDPWYDVMARVGSDRRDNICRFTHEYAARLAINPAQAGSSAQGFYSGPNAARGWNDTNSNLDPVLTNYRQLDTKLPAFTRDGETFLAVQAPSYITKSIKSIEGMRYRSKPTTFPYTDVERFQIREYPTGTDHLIAFEGGTGSAGTMAPAWSLMGFVLMHKTASGYDAHIVFRGSRSGASIAKTVWKAQDALGESKGNPDWITDLHSSKQVEKPLISKVGKVTEGFSESLPTMLGPIAACCKYLEQKYGAPEHIYVSGHSLGAGLASQFVSAVEQGFFGDDIRREVKTWPWDSATLMAYAQPIPGDPAWAANFNKVSPSSEHYWMAGDMVVEATSNRIVGMLIDKGEHGGIQKGLSKIDGATDNPHEVFLIRAAILKELSARNPALAQQLGRQNTWGYYENLAKMLAGKPKSYVYPGAPAPCIVTEGNLRDVLQTYNFGSEFAGWLETVYARMIADKSSYIGPKFQSTLDERRKLVLDVVEWMRKPSTADQAGQIEGLANEIKLIDGNLGIAEEEQWIDCGLILSRIQNANLPVKELLANPTIKTHLEAAPD